MGAEGVLVCGDESSLPDARGGLLGGEVPRAPRQPKWTESCGDGAGRDENDGCASVPAGGQHVDQGHESRSIQTTVRSGQRGGPHLDHEPVGGGDGGPRRHGERVY